MNKPKKECKTCKKIFIAKSNASKYCSKVCSPYFNTNPPIEVECKFCKERFTTKYRNKIYCSSSCGSKQWWQNVKLNGGEKYQEKLNNIKKGYNRWLARPGNREKKNEADRKYYHNNPEKAKQYYETSKEVNGIFTVRMRMAIANLTHNYGLDQEMFIKIYEEQGGLCLGCDIKLVSYVFANDERKQYDEDDDMILGVDYAVACVDHDHSYDIDGKRTGNSDSVRGLLCHSCNGKDVLNPESDNYIYGVDGDLNKKQLVMDVEFKKQLKKEAG